MVILGKGSAGAFALTHFTQFVSDQCEFELHHNPAIPPTTVGEGTNSAFPQALFENTGFAYSDLRFVDGSLKTGIYKEGWGDGKGYHHNFKTPAVSMHFNANKLQDYILDQLSSKYKMVETDETDYSKIDADFIMDCTGKPTDYTPFKMLETIPVNSVHVTQCYWEQARFQYTLTLARPWGWVFGIPLQNRCSIGYLYNNTITSLDEVKEDVKEVFAQYNLTPSNDTNTFSFKNYYRKKNFVDRVVYNGNASFFLEPMEATSIGTMGWINRYAYDYWFGNLPIEAIDMAYENTHVEVETMIMLHYLAGSKYKTKFWDFAGERAEKRIRESLKSSPGFNEIIEMSKQDPYKIRTDGHNRGYGSWGVYSFMQNFNDLGLYEKVDRLRE